VAGRPTSARITPLGDAAVAIELGRTIDPRLNARVHALDRAVQEAGLPGVRESVPAYASLLVHYDPLAVGYDDLAAALQPIVASTTGGPFADPRAVVGPQLRTPSSRSGRLRPAVIHVPVVYGDGAGPDLDEVARRAGMTTEEVIRRHAAADYRVAMIGFAPGFPYLMGMDPAIACPRLETPRLRVPAGSVGIADTQTGIYPFAMPGGWWLIGRTALRLFDPAARPPSLLRPGQAVRFVAVGGTAVELADRDALPAPREHSPPVAAAIRVLDPGFQTTVQDGGRWGFQRDGVPPSGAADPHSYARGNVAVGNTRMAAALEITAGGTSFEFLARCRVALAGAWVEATLDRADVASEAPVDAEPGMVLRFGRPARGLRTYLCVAGGIDVPPILGSRSTYLPAGFGGFAGRALRAGDELPVGPPEVSDRSRRGAGSRAAMGPAAPRATGPATVALPFVVGGQWEDHAPEAREAFVAASWRVSHQSDRIGLRFEGPPLGGVGRSQPFVSDGTVTGAIQVAGDGRPIVLLVDRQTTGGYPKLGAVASVALSALGQLAPGDEVRFVPMTVAEAQASLRT